MDPARWQRIESICFDALEHPPDARATFLENACAGDVELRRQVEILIAQVDGDPSFLERPLVDLSEPGRTRDETSGTGETSIGPYRVVRPLGRGGMGDVYLAMHEVEDVQQSVAIKVIRRGSDAGDLLHRFRLERRILAGLNHPHIARLLDAGATEDGRPYFVMEYVEGRPIDVFCDEERLSIERRLKLFQVICDAVQHAHQNLVVHRDLKPTNILVSDTGVPKLLDFGIGKVLDDSEVFGPAVETRTNVRMLTPRYAAPEQIADGAVTTATDVYALGVLLYELLTGRHPLVTGGESQREIEQVVLDAEPVGPSAMISRPMAPGDDATTAPPTAEISRRRASDIGQLRRRLAGDLDNIVLKALRKEPGRRYPSAAALGDDIRRHLRGLPVSARPDTFGYRARKFVRRHVAGVTATLVVFVALAVTTAVTLIQSRRVTLESERVALERDKALEVRGFLLEMFGASGAEQEVGDTVTVRQLLDTQVAQLDAMYADRPGLKADMLEVLADGYERLGLIRDAEPLAREALALRRRLSQGNGPDLAGALTLLGWIVRQAGRPTEAEPLVQEAVDIRRAAGERYELDLSRSLNDLGVIQSSLGRTEEAEQVLREALDIRLRHHREDHRSVGITANNLATVHYQQSNMEEAVRVQELAVRALTNAVGADHQRTIVAAGNLAAMKTTAGDWDGAVEEYRDLLERQTRIQGRGHPLTAHVMTSLANALAGAARARGEPIPAEAEALTQEAVAGLEARLGETHPQVGDALIQLGRLLANRGKLPEANDVQERAVRIAAAVYGRESEPFGEAVSRLASVRWRLGDVDRAIRYRRRAVEIFEASVGPNHGKTAGALGALCDMMMYQPEIASDALPICARAEELLGVALPVYRAYYPQVRLRLAQIHLALGSPAAADSILADVRSAAEAGEVPPPDPTLLDSLTAEVTRGR